MSGPQEERKEYGKGAGRRGVVRPLSIAPMMDWTDRHYRYMMRLLTRETLLYTEMITAAAIVYGDPDRLLRYHPIEHPVALQLGGSDPVLLAQAAKVGEDWGYDEINLNVGCPSSRVQEGTFGACLMGQPELVASLVDAMRRVVSIPVTVKHRIGIDDLDSLDDLKNFVRVVREASCDRFIVHARIALLDGLSPKENRTIPPLRWDDVFAIKEHFPGLWVEGNGEVRSLGMVQEKLAKVDGVMVGRAAYDDPYIFAEADNLIFDQAGPVVPRSDVVEGMLLYMEEHARLGSEVSYKCVTRHMMNLYKGQPGTKRWRQVLSGRTSLSVREMMKDAMADF